MTNRARCELELTSRFADPDDPQKISPRPSPLMRACAQAKG